MLLESLNKQVEELNTIRSKEEYMQEGPKNMCKLDFEAWKYNIYFTIPPALRWAIEAARSKACPKSIAPPDLKDILNLASPLQLPV